MKYNSEILNKHYCHMQQHKGNHKKIMLNEKKSYTKEFILSDSNIMKLKEDKIKLWQENQNSALPQDIRLEDRLGRDMKKSSEITVIFNYLDGVWVTQ